jgi:hypothetical protein
MRDYKKKKEIIRFVNIPANLLQVVSQQFELIQHEVS